MKLVGLMPCRNEDWVLALSARVALMWCDALVILDHASTDSTPMIIAELIDEHEHGRVIPLHRAGIWDEMAHRQLMLDAARELEATHISLVDADEILNGISLPHVRWMIESLPECGMLRAQLFNMRDTPSKIHINGLWGNRDVALAFRDDPRANWSGDQFHHREPQAVTWKQKHACGVMHLWAVDERRARAKQALYKLTERLRWPHKPVFTIESYYNQAIYPEKAQSKCFAVKEWTYAQAPDAWWEPYAHLMKHLDVAREPWQIEECRRIVRENPGIEKGLDLFGVI